MKSDNPRYASVLFNDVMMNGLAAFIGLFVLAFVLINQNRDERAIVTEGKYIIVVGWNSESQDDVDTYVMDPAGDIVFFQSREKGLMHLERDDLGGKNDTVVGPDGQSIEIKKNEERVVIRGVIAGEYLVNVHMYRKTDSTPTPVKITLIKLIGRDEEVVQKERILETYGDEKTAFRFTLNSKEEVTDINELSRMLVRKSGKPPGGDNQ